MHQAAFHNPLYTSFDSRHKKKNPSEKDGLEKVCVVQSLANTMPPTVGDKVFWSLTTTISLIILISSSFLFLMEILLFYKQK